jgi:phage terminase large subunit-like protein
MNGDLTICRSATEDIKGAADIVERIHKARKLPDKLAVGLDPYAISALVDELATRKIEGETITGIRQGSALSPATWGMERKLKDGTLWHAGSRLMAWCVGNARVEQRGNAVLITKQAAGKALKHCGRSLLFGEPVIRVASTAAAAKFVKGFPSSKNSL